jgi:uncharacterized protein (TIGR00369 family)
LTGLVATTPYTKYLGIALERDGDEYICRLPYRPDLIGNPLLPALHGGAIGALLESAAIFHLIATAEAATIPKTINLSIDYLRPGRPLDTFARGVATRQGRRVANVRVEAWQESRDRPIAAAHGLFLLASESGAAPR